jgi:hypothetical protein
MIKNHTNIRTKKEFEQYCLNTYATEGQKILSIGKLYDNLIHADRTDLISFIEHPPIISISDTSRSMTSLEYDLYHEIMTSIQIPSGNPSEFWFAIVYNGKVKGSKKHASEADVSGLVADVVVSNAGISVKNRVTDANSIAINFGHIPKKEKLVFNDIMALFRLITGKSLIAPTRVMINKMLDEIDNEQLITDLNNLKEWSKLYDDSIISRNQDAIEFILQDRGPGGLIPLFAEAIDSILYVKLNTVNWWSIIHGTGSHRNISTHTPAQIFENVKCVHTDRGLSGLRLSNNLGDFKDDMIRIKIQLNNN